MDNEGTNEVTVDAQDHVRAYSLRNAIGILTIEDVSALLGITKFALQQWRFFGQGPKYVKLGRSIYYRIVDLREWIDSNVLEPVTVRPKNKKVA